MSCQRTKGCAFYNGHDGGCRVKKGFWTLQKWLESSNVDVFDVSKGLSEIVDFNDVEHDEAFQDWETYERLGWLVVVLKDNTAITYCASEIDR